MEEGVAALLGVSMVIPVVRAPVEQEETVLGEEEEEEALSQ